MFFYIYKNNKKMKCIILLLSLFTLSFQQEIILQSQPLDVVKCLLQSEVLLNDFKRIVELIKEKDYLKLVVELIEMYPSAYEEIMKCLQTDINLEKSLKEILKPYSRKIYYQKLKIIKTKKSHSSGGGGGGHKF